MRRPAAAALAVALLALAAVAAAPAQGAGEDAPQWRTLMGQAVPTSGAIVPYQQAAGLPPTIQDGIGPGSALQMGVDGIQSVCTASFLMRDPFTGTYYLATAGHCLVRDAEDPEPITGATHPQKAKNRIDICVDGCLNNGLGLGTYVELKANEGYHPVAYAVSDGAGRDFGLIQLPPDVHGLLRPEMPQWGGPTGLADSPGIGDLVVHFGHGALLVPGVAAFVTRTPADQGRTAVLNFADGDSFEAVGHVTGGDSGSGISMAVVDPTGVATGTGALGTITHSIVYVGAPILSGTTLPRGIALAREHAGLTVELVTAGDPLPPGPTATPPVDAPSNLTVTSPAAGAAIGLDSKKVRITGFAERGGGPLANGTVVQVAIDDPGFGLASRVPVAGNSTWRGDWDLAGAKAGRHVILTRLVDADGAVLDSVNVTVTLQKGATPPGPSSSGTRSASGTATVPAADEDDGAPISIAPKGTPLGLAPLAAALSLALLAAARRRR